MDLNTITEVARPQSREQLPLWTAGDAWLAGGTWLFSEPQAHLARLIDLSDLKWPALTVGETSLTIAATCTVAQLDALICPPEWIASPLINQCCRAFLASFKIWKTATVGGNICMSLPAGPMISLTAALDGVCTIWQADGGERKIAVSDFVTGNNTNVLKPGDLLRQIDIPLAALRRQSAFRQISLTPVGRSAALLIRAIAHDGSILFTNTAFAEMVGREPDEVLSLRFHQIFHQVPASEYLLSVVHALANMLVELAHKDGSIVRALMSRSALMRADDQFALAVFQDLTVQLWEHEQ